MKTLRTFPGQRLALGHQGENNALMVVFNVGAWEDVYGSGTVHLAHKRHGDAEAYPVTITQEGSEAFWIVSDADTAVDGYGSYELRYVVGDTVVKSSVGETYVRKSLQQGASPPDPIQGWLDHVNEKEHDLLAAANIADAASKEAVAAASDAAASAKEAKEAAEQVVHAGVNVTANPGQMIRVQAVDDNGKPTAWEAVPWGWEETGMVELPVSGFWTAETLDSPSMFAVTAPLGLEIGKTYIVNWDGVEYSVVGKDMREISIVSLSGVWMGNQYIVTGDNDTGEPFVVVVIDDLEANAEGVYGVVIPADGRSGTEFHIYGDGEVVHKLPNKYLDLDWLPTLEENAILPEYTGVAQSDGGHAIMIIPYGGEAILSLDDGTELMMYVNGVGYPAVKIHNLDGDYIEAVDEKYVIAAWESSESSAFMTTEAGMYTVKVTTGEGNQNRLPDAFVPNSLAELPPKVQKLEENLEGQVAEVVEKYLEENPPSGGVQFETDDTLTLKNGVLAVNTTNDMEQDNTLPITSAGVYATVGNIEVLLKTI